MKAATTRGPAHRAATGSALAGHRSTVPSPGLPGFPAALRASALRVSCEVGANIFRAGSPTHSVYFVESGVVRLLRHGRAGEEVVLHEARGGEFFAEASLDSRRYHCDAVAAAPAELLRVPAAALRDLLDTDRDFAREWEALLARQLRAVRCRVERLSLKSAVERVRHLLVSEGSGPHCEVVIPGTLKDLARSLGLTHEALYRTLAAMERDGVIQREETALRLARQDRPARARPPAPGNESGPPAAGITAPGRWRGTARAGHRP